MCAIIPVGNLVSANETLEAQGFGPNNFSIPAYVGAGAQFAALHCWENPAFEAAVQALPGVIVEISAGDPPTRVRALIEAQGARWAAQAQLLPTSGGVTAGEMYQYEEANGVITLWSVIQGFDRGVYGDHPSTYPALIRRVRNPYSTEAWRQPLDQYDAYKLVNPFTGQPDRCTHNGSTWEVSQVDGAGNNVWEPGVFGWVVV